MARVYQVGFAENFEKELERNERKTVCAVLEPYDPRHSLLHLEKRIKGEAAQMLRSTKKYKLIFTTTKRKADQMESGRYVMQSDMDYQLIKKGKGIIMEIETPKLRLIK